MANEGLKQNAKPPYRDAEPVELEPYVIYDINAPAVLRYPMAHTLAERRADMETQLTPPQQWLEFCKKYGHDPQVTPHMTLVREKRVWVYFFIASMFVGAVSVFMLTVRNSDKGMWFCLVACILLAFACFLGSKNIDSLRSQSQQLRDLRRKYARAPGWVCKPSERTAKVKMDIDMRGVADEASTLWGNACEIARGKALSEYRDAVDALNDEVNARMGDWCSISLLEWPKLAAMVAIGNGSNDSMCARIEKIIESLEDLAAQCSVEFYECIEHGSEALLVLAQTAQRGFDPRKEYEARLALWEAMKALPIVAEQTRADIHAALVEAGYVEDEPEKPAAAEPAAEPTNLRVATDTVTAGDLDEREAASAAKPDTAKR